MADGSDTTDQTRQDSLRPMPWWVAVIATALVALSITATLLWLLSIARDDAELRIEAIKVGLSVGAGTGGAMALLLAFRRQWLSEHVAKDTAYDATERRVTDLYGQAVEQLGHNKAAVRLGGLYALERLAQKFPEHRQSVVDVVCAYLRMPFTPPDAEERQPVPADDDAGTRNRPAGEANSMAGEQELQVRLTAQRLLARHLAVPTGADSTSGLPATYWDSLRIDLAGAVLVDLDFSDCRFHQIDFAGAQFSGYATTFAAAQFSGTALFPGAQFSGYMTFAAAQFSQQARFDGAQFSGTAMFNEAQFSGTAVFIEAQFSEEAQFRQAQFRAHVTFGGAQFRGIASFSGAQFSEDIMFVDVPFSEEARRLRQAVATYANNAHGWPPGWHVEPPQSDSELGRLVRSDRPGAAIPNQRSDLDTAGEEWAN